MPRPLRPPRGIFSPTGLLFDPELPDTVKTTAMQLRALGWGQDETPPLSMSQICQELGKSQATLYGHMRLLRLRGALRWRPAGPTEIIVSFEPAYWCSENLEKPVNGVEEVDKSTNKPKKERFQISGKSETRAIQDEYVKLLGYAPDDWAAGEAVAAKALALKYTVDEFRAAYLHYKSQPFWKDKRLTLRYLKNQIAEYLQSSNGRKTLKPKLTPEEVSRLNAELNPKRKGFGVAP